MILVAHEKGSKELAPLITKYGVKSQITTLPFGDFAFDGNGPTGPVSIGVERKTLHDLLSCIDDARYGGFQKVGMEELYGIKYLLVEGMWKPHDQNGYLMEGNYKGQWWMVKPYTMYSKMRRYLFSVAHAGVTVIYTRDMEQSAYDLCEMYHYYQKPWDKHTSLLQIPTPHIASLMSHPSVCQYWAFALKGIGQQYSEEAARLFNHTPLKLALSNMEDWTKIRGVGKTIAAKVLRQIRGER